MLVTDRFGEEVALEKLETLTGLSHFFAILISLRVTEKGLVAVICTDTMITNWHTS